MNHPDIKPTTSIKYHSHEKESWGFYLTVIRGKKDKHHYMLDLKSKEWYSLYCGGSTLLTYEHNPILISELDKILYTKKFIN